MIKKQTRKTSINSLDHIHLYPTFATRTEDGSAWRVRVHGMVFGAGVVNFRQRLMLRLLRSVMRVEAEAMESELFQQRISGFVASPEKGRRIEIRAGEHRFLLPKETKRNGQFAGTFRLTNDAMEELVVSGHVQDDWLRIGVESPHAEHASLTGRVKLVESSGVTVISDIDDTIKHTEVRCRRSLLANTFLREFQSVEGMSEIYNTWRQQGAVFHYVSSSPWQLFSPLQDYCHTSGFPQGTLHLRSFRLRDHMLRRILLLRRHGKAAVIRGMIESFPERQFVLVGDSGEKDPEMYGSLARRFPEQIASVFIRDIPQRPMTEKRARRAFRRLSEDQWSVFQSAEELPPHLPVPAPAL